MQPGTKGLIAATAFALVHAGIIAAGAAVIAAEPGATAKPVTAPVTSAAKVAAAPAIAPAPAAPAEPRALDERRSALTFLSHLANGEHDTGYGMLARETRDGTSLKTFEKAFAPISTLGLQQVTWSKITERRAQTSYTPATGYTKSPAITALEGTASSKSGPVRVEFTLVDSPEGWKIQHFRFKKERSVKTASR